MINRRFILLLSAAWVVLAGAVAAGSAGAMWFGDLDANFAPLANMSDATMRELAYDTDGRYTADLTPRDARSTTASW